MKTLSVVIPAYNCEKTIEKTIQSIDIKNHLDDIEILIIDDESKDSTQKICRKLSSQYPNNVFYYRKNNGNYGSVMNFAKNKISGRFVRTLDSDDQLETESLGKLIDELKKIPSEVDVVFCNFSFVNCSTNKKSKNSLKWWFQLPQDTVIYSFDKIKKWKYSGLTIHSIIFSNKVFKEINMLPEGIFYTDSYLVYQIMKLSKYLAYIPHLYIYKYYVNNNEQSISMENMVKNKEHVIKVFKSILNDNIPNNISKKHMTWMTCIIRLILMFNLTIISFEKNKTDEEKTKEISDIFLILKNNIKNNTALLQVLDNSLNLFFKFKSKTITKTIKVFYGLINTKFVKASKSSKKDGDVISISDRLID